MAISPRNENPANSINVPAEPIASVKVKNVSLTSRFEVQLETAAIPPPMPLYLNGYISEFTIQGTVPMPGEYNMMYNPKRAIAKPPILLGQPLVYHTRCSAPQTPFVASFTSKQAPGRY